MKKKSIYKYASEAGLPAGLYLTLMSACLLLSVKIPSLPMLILPLAIGFPLVLWALVRNIAKAEPSYNKFSSLWLGGIYTTIFGTLICLFLSAIYVVFYEPAFVVKYFTQAIDAVEASEFSSQYQAQIALMREAIEAKILPSGLEFLTSMAWFTCFSGSMISLPIAYLISKGSRKVSREVSI